VTKRKPYLTKAIKINRAKNFTFLFTLLFAFVVVYGYWNINESKISSNLNEIKQNELILVSMLKNSSEDQFCVQMTPEQLLIKEVADLKGYKDLELLFCLAYEESKYDQFAVGVNIHYQSDGSVLTTEDLGIFQINNYWHSEISSECTFDIKCSTNETINILRQDGGCKQWSTCEKCK